MIVEIPGVDVAGYIPGTKVYRDNDTLQHYLISAPPWGRARVDIFLATLDYYPITDWNPQPPADPEQPLNRIGVDCIIRPIVVDADGDPLNGLTPLHVLPAGTTHQQAVDYLTQLEDPELP